jgi:CheY-like chemotaxis protein
MTARILLRQGKQFWHPDPTIRCSQPTMLFFGLSIVKAEIPDLIILDVIMPFEDGFKAARELKAEPELAKIPIIILASFPRSMGETYISVSQCLDLKLKATLKNRSASRNCW